MELIYTDAEGVDEGYLDYSTADFAWGADENDFSVTLADGARVPARGARVYQEGGPLGGIVRCYGDDGDGHVVLEGTSWTGALDYFVVGPSRGSAYLRLSGDLQTILRNLVSRAGLGWLATVPDVPSGISANHTFRGSTDAAQADTGRYMGCWAAVWQLLLANNAKLSMRWDADARRVSLQVSPRTDWTDDEHLAVAAADVRVRVDTPVNHLTCLGQGELAAREVLELYSDSRGRVSRNQSLFGLWHRGEVFDDSSAEDLAADGRKKLAELWDAATTVEVGCSEDGPEYDLGDLVGGTNEVTGITAKAAVTKKIVTATPAGTAVTYATTRRS